MQVQPTYSIGNFQMNSLFTGSVTSDDDNRNDGVVDSGIRGL